MQYHAIVTTHVVILGGSWAYTRNKMIPFSLIKTLESNCCRK